MLDTLMSAYRQNIIVCMLQDLKNIYVYWDLRKERIDALINFVCAIKPGLNVMLRLSKQYFPDEPLTTEEEINFYRIESGNYYFRDIDPNATYFIEFGAKTPEGRLIRFFQSSGIRVKPLPDEIATEPVVINIDTNELENIMRESLSGWS